MTLGRHMRKGTASLVAIATKISGQTPFAAGPSPKAVQRLLLTVPMEEDVLVQGF